MSKFIEIAGGDVKVQTSTIALQTRPAGTSDAVTTFRDGSTKTFAGLWSAFADLYFIDYNGAHGLDDGSGVQHRLNPEAVTNATKVGTEVTLQVEGAGTVVLDKGNLNGIWNALPV